LPSERFDQSCLAPDRADAIAMLTLTLTLPILAALIEIEGVTVGAGGAAAAELEACARGWRERAAAHGWASPGAVPGIDAARALFRALGIDPTKRRPSSEALLHRALRGHAMPAINPLVDAGNAWSLEHLLPLGLYDGDAIRGDVVLRRGGPGDVYEAISGARLDLDGRYLLADEDGPFGSPITDSKRTAVTTGTTRAAIVVYAPPAYGAARLREGADDLVRRVARLCGGRAAQIVVLGEP
jgi:DNA/RNA-binding domain of Phe-tRNA-synthetase-like protein